MNIDHSPLKEKPDFIVAGVIRCGTSWLDEKLRLHPEIGLPADRKELSYFNHHYDRGPGWYASFFATRIDAAVTVRGEVSPGYFHHPRAFSRIGRDVPGCRIVIIVRNPIDRLYSQYSYSQQHNSEGFTFTEYLERRPRAFDTGLYAHHLTRLYELFPPPRVRLLVFENVIAEPVPELRALVTFLGVDPAGIPDELPSRRVNASFKPRYPRTMALARSLKRAVRRHDQEWIIRLAKGAGAARLLESTERFEPLDAVMRRELANRYAPEVEALAARHPELDLSSWVDFRSESRSPPGAEV